MSPEHRYPTCFQFYINFGTWVGGSMIEVTTSSVASIFVAVIANKYLARLQRKQAARMAATASVDNECTEQPANA